MVLVAIKISKEVVLLHLLQKLFTSAYTDCLKKDVGIEEEYAEVNVCVWGGSFLRLTIFEKTTPHLTF